MADGASLTAFMDEAMKALDGLGGEVAQKLARSMAVAGGTVIRDEAKALAPVYTPGIGRNGKPQRINKKAAAKPGALAAAIYLAFADTRSTATEIRYVVSWNKSQAPHGHLVEFGHWLVEGKRPGRGQPDTRERIKWVPAYPFMRPAYESAGDRAVAAMIGRGTERLPELLAGKGGTHGDD